MHYHKALLHVKIDKHHESSHSLKHLDPVDCVDQFTVNCFALLPFLNFFVYNITIFSCFPFLLPKVLIYAQLIFLKFINLFSLFLVIHTHMHTHIQTSQIPEYKILSLYTAISMHIFRDDHLILNSQQVCSSFYLGGKPTTSTLQYHNNPQIHSTSLRNRRGGL